MSYLISGLNIKNIYEYDSSQSYGKYDVVDYQLNTNFSVYPNYTGLGGQSGLNFWFNSESLGNFNLDSSNLVTGWDNLSDVKFDGDDYKFFIQNSAEENARPFVDFNENYLPLKDNEFLSGEGFDCIDRTIFMCFEASSKSNFSEQTLLYIDKSSGAFETEFPNGPSGLFRIKGEDSLGSSKIIIDDREFSAVSPIYGTPNIVTIIQTATGPAIESSGPTLEVRQNGVYLGRYPNFYSGWVSGFMQIGRNENPNGIKYYDMFAFSGVLTNSEIENYEKYLFESYFDNEGLYFAKQEVPAGEVRAPVTYTGSAYWTKDIDDLFNLTYGSSASFSSKLNTIDFGDGYKSALSRNVNSLNVSFDLKYEGLSDKEAKALITFFENSPEAPNKSVYESYEGVDINLFQPYKQDAEVYFLDISHETPYNDINNISIKAESLYDSSLDYKGMLIKLDEQNIRTYTDDLSTFEYNDVVYVDNISYSKRGYYFYTGERTSSSLPEVNAPLGNNSSFTKEFYFKVDVDYSISSNLRVSSSDIENSTNQYKKDGINYNKLELDLAFSNRSNKEALAMLKFFDDRAGFKFFRYTLPQPYNKEMLFYCPEWQHTYNFFNNNDISAKFVHLNDVEDFYGPTVFNTKISFTS
jgi:phage-related protein